MSSAAERRLKVWAVPDEVYDEPLPRDPETGYVQEQEPPDKKTRPPIQVHNPIASTNIVHADHPDQLEWLDEVRLLTKARTGRTIMGRSKAGVCAEVVIWRFDLLLELAKRHSIDNGLGLGLSGAQQSEGALKLLKRFVIPRQGFWGHTMAFDPSRMTIALPFIGGVWEAKVDLVPFKWGFSTYSRPFDRPDLERSASTDDWEAISPTANSYSNKTLFGVSYSPDGQYAVASGEDGTLLVWKRERDNMIEDVKEENKNAMDEN